MTWEEEGPWSNRCFSLMWEEEFCLLFLFFFLRRGRSGGVEPEMLRLLRAVWNPELIKSFLFLLQRFSGEQIPAFFTSSSVFHHHFFFGPLPSKWDQPRCRYSLKSKCKWETYGCKWKSNTGPPRWDPSTSSAYADFLLYIDVKCIVVSQLSGTLWRDKNMLS